MTDDRQIRYRDRLIRLEQEKRDSADAIKDLMIEAKSAGLLKEELAGIKLNARRYFEKPAKRQEREAAESISDALGEFADTPLGVAAISSSRKAA
jgi:uncharacterized protein (UPF0335 family)